MFATRHRHAKLSQTEPLWRIANRVSSHPADKVHHWPGVESLTAIDQDFPLVAAKPLGVFDQNNKAFPRSWSSALPAPQVSSTCLTTSTPSSSAIRSPRRSTWPASLAS